MAKFFSLLEQIKVRLKQQEKNDMSVTILSHGTKGPVFRGWGEGYSMCWSHLAQVSSTRRPQLLAPLSYWICKEQGKAFSQMSILNGIWISLILLATSEGGDWFKMRGLKIWKLPQLTEALGIRRDLNYSIVIFVPRGLGREFSGDYCCLKKDKLRTWAVLNLFLPEAY